MRKLENRIELKAGATINELIDILNKFPGDAVVEICGNQKGEYVHYDDGDNVVNINWDSLDKSYCKKNDKHVEEES